MMPSMIAYESSPVHFTTAPRSAFRCWNYVAFGHPTQRGQTIDCHGWITCAVCSILLLYHRHTILGVIIIFLWNTRGKTFIARSIQRHLLSMGLDAELFDVSIYRRKLSGAQHGQFFHPDNAVYQRQRAQAAELAMNDALEKLKGTLSIAILDGSNITQAKRRLLYEQVARSNLHCQIVFIESVCYDQEVVRSLMKETYVRSPDFANQTEEDAVADMAMKIQHFEVTALFFSACVL